MDTYLLLLSTGKKTNIRYPWFWVHVGVPEVYI